MNIKLERLFGRADYYLRPFKLGVIFQIIRNRLHKKGQLDTLDISVGYECNMRCEHCSAQILTQSREKLTLLDYRILNAELDRMGIYRINITGGEPLLFPWLEDLIRSLKPYKRHIKIQTNGTLLTESRIVSLKKSGVNAISMSLDSLNEKEFEKFRGLEGSFRTIVNNINLVRKHRLQVSLGCVVTHQNIRSGELAHLINFAYENKCHLLLNIAVAVGRWANKEEFLFDQAGKDREYFNVLLKKYPHIHTDHDNGGCPGALRKIYLTPYGDVIPCPFIHVSFGNIKVEALSEIRRKMLQHYTFFGLSQCPAAENKEVIDGWLKKLWDADTLPVSYENVTSPTPKGVGFL